MPETEQEWWEADAQRHNTLGDLARQRGYLLGEDGGKPPRLNPDGSLKNPPQQKKAHDAAEDSQ